MKKLAHIFLHMVGRSRNLNYRSFLLSEKSFRCVVFVFNLIICKDEKFSDFTKKMFQSINHDKLCIQSILR